MQRPPVANCDMALLVFSVHSPDISFDLIDRYLICLEKAHLTPVLIFSKNDLNTPEDEANVRSVYRDSGYEMRFISTDDKNSIADVRQLIEHHVATVAGPSGAGKSSLLNALTGREELETQAVSKATGRGRQTTRHTELVALSADTFICDTPGFSTVYLPKIPETEAKVFFNEFDELSENCRFRGCVHINEPSCAVKKAVEEGQISRVRYDDYCRIYEELKDINKRSYR